MTNGDLWECPDCGRLVNATVNGATCPEFGAETRYKNP